MSYPVLLTVVLMTFGFLVAKHSWAATITSDVVQPGQADITGTARNLSGKLIYREFHRFSPTEHRVDYQTANGEWLAHKSINYDKIAGVVSFDLYYPDTRRRERVTSANGEITVNIRSRQKDINHQLAYRAGDVVDAGFDALVRDQWTTLVAGKPVRTRFLLFRRGRWMDMTIAKTGNKYCQEKYQGSVDYCLSIKPTTLLLRMVVPELLLAYNNKQQLSMYFGPTNLEFEENEPGSLVITYQYAASGVSDKDTQ